MAPRRTQAAADEPKSAHTLWFDEIHIEDVGRVGGKSASLGEMYQQLTAKGVSVPNGFAVTAQAYFYFIDEVSWQLFCCSLA